MIPASTAAGLSSVPLDDLRVGELLAEGGEGRVYQLPLQPHLVYKAYRRPVRRDQLETIVAWPELLESRDPKGSVKVRSASAWPTGVVTGAQGEASGILLPRAPRRFAVRHRDGTSRLASLSYLTTDPVHRASAYGLQLPEPASPHRIGLVYALARLLAAFESGEPAIGHGDLSTKNVLWSLQRGAEVFVIDCDNCEQFSPDGSPLGSAGRRRAMTPNWDDPAVARGDNPTPFSDRYSLALIFLRVVGAANFPIQARQRSGEEVAIDFSVPAGPHAGPLLDPANPVWDLCARGLSVTNPAARPSATAWIPALRSVLAAMGVVEPSAELAAAPAPVAGAPSPGDVVIRPVPGPRRPDQRPTRSRQVTTLRPHYDPTVSGGGFRWVPNQGPATGAAPQPPASKESVWPEVRAGVGRAAVAWLAVHRRLIASLLTPGRRAEGIRLAAFCGLIDAALAVVGLFFAAMVVSPVVGL
jgi:hypothetical protein